MGKYGDFMGTLQQIAALVVGEKWGLRFCSTERRLGTIDCSLDRGKMAEEKKKVCFKINCFLSIIRTIRQKFVRICRHKQL